MRQNLIAYFSTLVVFFGMDFVWLSFSSSRIYKPKLGALLLAEPNLAIAGVFYLVYIIGIVIFAIMPALEQGHFLRALWGGALLGLVSYGAYDFTNQATIAGWSWTVTCIDLTWGTFATGVAASVGYLVTKSFQG